VGVACDLGYPCAKFRLPRPFGFRVRANVRDIRRTDRRTTDADDCLMPPSPLLGRGHNKANVDLYSALTCNTSLIRYRFPYFGADLRKLVFQSGTSEHTIVHDVFRTRVFLFGSDNFRGLQMRDETMYRRRYESHRSSKPKLH